MIPKVGEVGMLTLYAEAIVYLFIYFLWSSQDVLEVHIFPVL